MIDGRSMVKGLVECGAEGDFNGRLSRASYTLTTFQEVIRRGFTCKHLDHESILIKGSIECSARGKLEVKILHAFEATGYLYLALDLGINALVYFVSSSRVVSAASQRLAQGENNVLQLVLAHMIQPVDFAWVSALVKSPVLL